MPTAQPTTKWYPIPKHKRLERQERQKRLERISRGDKGTVIEAVEAYLKRFLVLEDLQFLATSAWIVAAWLSDLWDRFPHLVVTSAEMRSGKTRFLEVLELITFNALLTPNMSLAAIFRYIEETDPKPTLLLDEMQSLGQGQSKSDYGQALSALRNSSIRRKDCAMRCGSSEDGHTPTKYSNYCPKALALIGDLNGVLADRSLPVRMKRKTKADHVEKYRERTAKDNASEIHEALSTWADEHREDVQVIYDQGNEFDLENDRMAELLTPLQSVLTVADPKRLDDLKKYALELDAKDPETETPGVQLLRACRAIFAKSKKNQRFMPTIMLINTLKKRDEEPWGTYNPRNLDGKEITARQLANLLKQYGIRSAHSKDPSKQRGYFASDFEESWNRYLVPLSP